MGGGVSTIVLALSPCCWHKVPLKHAMTPVSPPWGSQATAGTCPVSPPPGRRAEVRSLTSCCLLINEKPEISPPGTAPRPHLTPSYRPRRGRAPALGHVEPSAALWLRIFPISVQNLPGGFEPPGGSSVPSEPLRGLWGALGHRTGAWGQLHGVKTCLDPQGREKTPFLPDFFLISLLALWVSHPGPVPPCPLTPQAPPRAIQASPLCLT